MQAEHQSLLILISGLAVFTLAQSAMAGLAGTRGVRGGVRHLLASLGFSFSAASVFRVAFEMFMTGGARGGRLGVLLATTARIALARVAFALISHLRLGCGGGVLVGGDVLFAFFGGFFRGRFLGWFFHFCDGFFRIRSLLLGLFVAFGLDFVVLRREITL